MLSNNDNDNQQQTTTLLLQVMSSHLDRILQFSSDLAKADHKFPIPIIIGSSSSHAKNVSFIYLHIIDRTTTTATTTTTNTTTTMSAETTVYWCHHFASNPILARFGVRKMYAFDQIVKVPFSQQTNDTERANFLMTHAMHQIHTTTNTSSSTTTTTEDLIVKVQTFPPKRLQHKIVQSLYQK